LISETVHTEHPVGGHPGPDSPGSAADPGSPLPATRRPALSGTTRSCAPRRPDWAPRFLEAYRATGIVHLSAAAAGIERSTCYKRAERDAAFAASWADAHEDRIDAVEAEAFRLALEEHQPGMVALLLRAHRPARYRDRVDVRLDIRPEAERVAERLGIPVEEVLERLERKLRGVD